MLITVWCRRYETASTLFQQRDFENARDILQSAIALWSPRQVAYEARAMHQKLNLILTPDDDTTKLQEITAALTEVLFDFPELA